MSCGVITSAWLCLSWSFCESAITPAAAKMRDHTLWMDGREQAAVIYDRSKLRQGDVIRGPAIVVEMDATTLIESGCVARVDKVGNILIEPVK
mgnify:CR=1 FL=1